MKRRMLFLISIGIMFILTSCLNQSETSIERIVAPQSIEPPIEGKWKITHCFNKNSNAIKEDTVATPWIGSFAQFNGDEVRMGDYLWRNPGYKTKQVDFKRYALENIGESIYNKIDFTNKPVYIISLASKVDFALEFVKLDDNRIISVFQDKVMLLQRDSDNTDYFMAQKPLERNESQMYISGNKQIDSTMGVLLGIKYVNDSGEYSYKTLWISRERGVMNPVYEMENIFLPRTDGFWQVEIKKTGNDLASEQYLNASRQFKSNTTSNLPDMNRDFWKDKEGTLYKDIVCIGNDYVAMEVRGTGKFTGSGALWNESSLRIYPIDSSADSGGVSISDLAGQAGTDAYMNAVNGLRKDGVDQDVLKSMEYSNHRNFALYRKNGQWLYNGRINFSSEENQVPYEYNINSRPPENFIKYDILYIPWKHIKERVPEAIDAYTSPSKDFAVVVSSTKILVFNILDGRLAEAPTQKINIQKGSSVVMAEWTQSSYMFLWDKAFKANQTTIVKED